LLLSRLGIGRSNYQKGRRQQGWTIPERIKTISPPGSLDPVPYKREVCHENDSDIPRIGSVRDWNERLLQPVQSLLERLR
jgi:hypothetical protein